MIVTALFQSFGPLLNVLVFIFVIFLIFAILGMSLLSQKMGFCDFLSGESYYGVGFKEVNLTFVTINLKFLVFR